MLFRWQREVMESQDRVAEGIAPEEIAAQDKPAEDNAAKDMAAEQINSADIPAKDMAGNHKDGKDMDATDIDGKHMGGKDMDDRVDREKGVDATDLDGKDIDIHDYMECKNIATNLFVASYYESRNKQVIQFSRKLYICGRAQQGLCQYLFAGSPTLFLIHSVS